MNHRIAFMPALRKTLIARWRLPRWLCAPTDLPALAGWLHRNDFLVAETRFVRKGDGAEVTVFAGGMVKANAAGGELVEQPGCWGKKRAQKVPDNKEKEYPVRSIVDFSTADWMDFAKRERKLYQGVHKLELLGREANEGRQQALADDTVRLMSEGADEIIEFLIPTLPKSRIREIESSDKLNFYTWWKDQQPQEAVPATQAIEVQTT